MNRYIPLLLLALCTDAFGQTKTRKLPQNINHPGLNLFVPFMSQDGKSLIFLSDNTDRGLTTFYTSRTSVDWREPIALPKNVNSPLNFLRGYALSADGRTLFITMNRSGGVGGYDIYSSEKTSTGWAEPKNLAMPINSKLHDGCPSVNTDGTALYFMRCEKMDANKADACKILVTKKKTNGQWDEPQELPAFINTGNSQTPRIMADGETLYFSSDKFPGNKGGMDLYMTRFANGAWSNPVPLDFVNTDKDDQYVTVTTLGRYLLRDAPGARKNELVEYLIPNDMRPKGIMRIDGMLTDPSVAAYISITDMATGKRESSIRPKADGSFTIYLREGTRYELSVDPELGSFTFFSKIFDLTNDNFIESEKVSVPLKRPEPGDEIQLETVAFKRHSSQLESSSQTELKKLARMIRESSGIHYEIQVLLSGLIEESYQSSPDLTEIYTESITSTYEDIDSLGQLYKRDTVIQKITYHNDRTKKQAEAVLEYLISQGVDASRLSYFNNAREEMIPDQRKLVVKAVIRKK